MSRLQITTVLNIWFGWVWLFVGRFKGCWKKNLTVWYCDISGQIWQFYTHFFIWTKKVKLDIWVWSDRIWNFIKIRWKSKKLEWKRLQDYLYSPRSAHMCNAYMHMFVSLSPEVHTLLFSLGPKLNTKLGLHTHPPTHPPGTFSKGSRLHKVLRFGR